MLKPAFTFLCFFVLLTGASETKYSLQTDRIVPFEQIKGGFLKPPAESGLRCYWWWLNSMATKESITRDLEEMKAKGYGGASLVDAGSSNYQVAAKTQAGPVFMSPEWMELYKHAVREAERIGIELSVNVQSGWNPGAPSITPEFAMKKIVWSEVNVKGGKMIKMNLTQPEEKLKYWDYMVQAIPQKEGLPIQDQAIQNWKKKSFKSSFGGGGIFPLHELREDYPGDGSEIAIRKEEIIDLSKDYQNGELQWNAPPGNWTIIRYGYTCTGARTSTNSDGWEGLSVDHLSPKAFELFSKTVIIPLIETAQAAGKSVKFLQTDSWEMDVVSWTALFPDEFQKFRGYDIKQYLPVLAGRIIDNRDETDRFLHDFRKTVGDCVAENHYRLFANLAHQYGMGIHPESGGPHSAPVDALRVMGISDFPQGEFWAVANTHRIRDDQRLCVKQSACVAHTNGKRFVAAEGPTSIGPQWERSPKDLKGNLDRIFCSGVNRIVWHTFTSSPKEFGRPGNEYFAGTHLNPNVTWWKQSKDFISYLDRSCFMLQQGLYVADVLYYYGDDVPNFVFLKEELPELHYGYDWDKCSKDVILNRLTFDGEKIVLPDGMSYRVLMLAPEKSIDLAVLRKIEALVNAGMTVIGPRPLATSGLSGFPASDQELKAITDRMWGKIDGKNLIENRVGKGKVIWGLDANKVLDHMKVQPDFGFQSGQPKTALDYIHRTTGSSEIYFVSNRFARKGIDDFEYRYLISPPDRYELVNCSFRVTGKIPQLWNPKTGEITDVLTYREVAGKTILPLFLEPEGSIFVVFREAKADRHIIAVQKDGKNLFPDCQLEPQQIPFLEATRDAGKKSATIFVPGTYSLTWSDGITKVINASSVATSAPAKAAPTDMSSVGLSQINLSSNWQVNFDPKWGGPENLSMAELKPWNSFEIPGIKYYSGTAVYTRSFTCNNTVLTGNKVFLDLGHVQEMASVNINGKQLQVIWSAPFRYDITDYVKQGENKLAIEVVNMWPNRLIGDAKLPVEQRITKTNINKFNGPDGEKYLRESGLMGPVIVKFVKKYPLN